MFKVHSYEIEFYYLLNVATIKKWPHNN